MIFPPFLRHFLLFFPPVGHPPPLPGFSSLPPFSFLGRQHPTCPLGGGGGGGFFLQVPFLFQEKPPFTPSVPPGRGSSGTVFPWPSRLFSFPPCCERKPVLSSRGLFFLLLPFAQIRLLSSFSPFQLDVPSEEFERAAPLLFIESAKSHGNLSPRFPHLSAFFSFCLLSR